MTTFAELAKINVNDRTEKKGNLTYLSWAWAVDQLLRKDDAASWEYRWVGDKPFATIGETCMVFCTVRAFGKDRTAQLPVMDHRNKAISSPNAMEVNTAMQRCLAKAIALHGIGLYIYAGEDLPDAGDAPNSDIQAPNHKPVAQDVWDSMPPDVQTDLNDMAMTVIHELEVHGGLKAMELLSSYNLDADRKVALWSRFNSKERAAMEPHKRKRTNGEAHP
jgi:hypothetical protein